jgi:hypothetical protein
LTINREGSKKGRTFNVIIIKQEEEEQWCLRGCHTLGERPLRSAEKLVGGLLLFWRRAVVQEDINSGFNLRRK